jgi:succinate dehydrogenase/fumarate reductase flavoprotein subunit
VEIHVEDSLKGGRFINDRKLLTVVAKGAQNRISNLEKWGARFYRKDGRIKVSHTPGHTYPRHVRGERQTGKDFILPQRSYAQKIGIRFVENIFVTRLFESHGDFIGAIGLDQKGGLIVFSAKSCVLATGGFGQAYLFTNNAAGLTGDGHALCFELGLPIRDMEFVQFYPTCLGKGRSRILLYEAFVFRSGATIRNRMGEDILKRHGLQDPLLMTRDRLTRAIMEEILEGRDIDGGVIMDLGKVPEDQLSGLQHLLPGSVLTDEREFNVSPTAHFCMGGLHTDEKAGTELKGLFSAGELCGGVHGANRLAGNALSEAFTMGDIAGKNAALAAEDKTFVHPSEETVAREESRLRSILKGGEADLKEMRNRLKNMMWYKTGIIRSGKSLKQALDQLGKMKSDSSRLNITTVRSLIKALEYKNLLLVSEMVCRAALFRTESRGAHFRSDYPDEDNQNWLKNVIIRKNKTTMEVVATPVEGKG